MTEQHRNPPVDETKPSPDKTRAGAAAPNEERIIDGRSHINDDPRRGDSEYKETASIDPQSFGEKSSKGLDALDGVQFEKMHAEKIFNRNANDQRYREIEQDAEYLRLRAIAINNKPLTNCDVVYSQLNENQNGKCADPDTVPEVPPMRPPTIYPDTPIDMIPVGIVEAQNDEVEDGA